MRLTVMWKSLGTGECVLINKKRIKVKRVLYETDILLTFDHRDNCEGEFKFTIDTNKTLKYSLDDEFNIELDNGSSLISCKLFNQENNCPSLKNHLIGDYITSKIV